MKIILVPPRERMEPVCGGLSFLFHLRRGGTSCGARSILLLLLVPSSPEVECILKLVSNAKILM